MAATWRQNVGFPMVLTSPLPVLIAGSAWIEGAAFPRLGSQTWIGWLAVAGLVQLIIGLAITWPLMQPGPRQSPHQARTKQQRRPS